MNAEQIKTHEDLRNTLNWGTYGKDGDEFRRIPLKEMTDSHLLHVIGNILESSHGFSVSTLDNMLNEAAYRHIKHIFISE